MANKVKTQLVQGFKVSNFLVKCDEVRLVLTADKSDLRAGTYGIGDILSWLELHVTADYNVELSLATEDVVEETEK